MWKNFVVIVYLVGFIGFMLLAISWASSGDYARGSYFMIWAFFCDQLRREE
jgi:hypothetical protein